jgi:hypothetical protein
VPEGEFDFLGYTFGRMYSAKTGQARIGYRPSKKSVRRAVEKIHALSLSARSSGSDGSYERIVRARAAYDRRLRRIDRS